MTNYSSIRAKQQNSNSQPIRILIVDDQKVVRARLEEILSSRNNYQLVGMADDGEKAIAAIYSLRPDVVLMDIEMPKMNGIKITEIISHRFPESKILILTSHEDNKYVKASIVAGASGYIAKNTSAANLIAAIETVNRGYSHFELKTLQQVQLEAAKTQQSKRHAFLKQQSSPPVDPEVTRSSNSPAVSPAVVPASQQKQNSRVPSALPAIEAAEFLPPIGKWLTWRTLSAAILLAAAIPATSILKYKTKVEAQATVHPVGETLLVRANSDGKIVELPVKPGQAVKKGDLIAKVDPSRWQTQKNRLTKALAQRRLQLAQLDTQIGIIKSQIIAQTQSNNSEVLAAKAELAGNRRNYRQKNIEVNTQIKEARARIEAVEATLNAARLKQQRYQAVADRGALSREQLAEAQLQVEQQQQELTAAKAQLERAKGALKPSQSEVEITQQRIYQLEESGRAGIASLNREQRALWQQHSEIQQEIDRDVEAVQQIEIDSTDINITAPADGTIAELNLRNLGQTVQPGQEIARVIPDNVDLEIKALVPHKEIGKLETDQRVQIEISACPYYDFGTLSGRVSHIAKDSSKPHNNASQTSSSNSAAFYEVSIAPAQTEFGRGQNICSLDLGMEGQANIITKEESMIRFLLRKARLIGNF